MGIVGKWCYQLDESGACPVGDEVCVPLTFHSSVVHPGVGWVRDSVHLKSLGNMSQDMVQNSVFQYTGINERVDSRSEF